MYTAEFKQAAVQKAELRAGRPVSEIARELGVSVQLLNYWRKQASVGGMKKPKKSPSKLSLVEKQEILLKSSAMSEAEMGEFLRREGLHTTDLEQWKADILDHLRGPSRAERSDENKLRFEKVRLEKELRRKNRALAETAALLVLQKKVSLLLGRTEEDEE